jgi:light-regulated signal transduction histidine kinase (bacteriophytochrome)
MDMVTIPLRSEKGSTNYSLTLGLPITERKEAEEQKEKTSKMLEDIAFRASHKVRGPIARIQGLMNLIDGSYIEKNEMSSITQLLKESIAEMDVTTRELTSFVNTHYEEESSIGNQNIFRNLDKAE